MDGYRVFTWDNKKFNDPKQTLTMLKDRGYKVVTIIDPGVKKDKGYKIYDEGIKNNYFATDKDGIPYVNKVWPGDSLYPNFANEKVRKWWGGNQEIIMRYGVAGIWNDMNEPASFNGPLPDDVFFDNDGVISDHKEIHNTYGHFMSKATYEGIRDYTKKRPFVITRACYAGTQKYSTVWTGDNQSSWEHLRMSLPMLMNLGLSGMIFCGADIGGFSFDCTGELLSRWVQVGAFTPLFRNHSRDYTRDQEPWAFDELTEEINRKYIKLRYRLIPYLYDLMWNAESTGLPVVRPLFLNYQQDENTYEINDEFLCGENILVAPMVEQGKIARVIYLPKGDCWIDYWTKETFEGGQYIIKKASLDVCPIYIKAGSIIPNYQAQNYIGEIEIKELVLDIYPSANNEESSYINYQDDGESFEYRKGAFNLYKFDLQCSDNSISLKLNYKKGYERMYECFKVKINNVEASEVVIDDVKVHFAHVDNGIEFSVNSTNKNCFIKTK
jgi:alpha-glucosidase